VPSAVTQKETLAPAETVWDSGWAVMVGGTLVLTTVWRKLATVEAELLIVRAL